MKSKLITILLTFFFGGLGFHRMYLGQVGIGIVYILFCWTFIPGIIAIIELIYFILMSKEDFNNKYNLDYMIKKKQYENLK